MTTLTEIFREPLQTTEGNKEDYWSLPDATMSLLREAVPTLLGDSVPLFARLLPRLF